ncbi:Histone-binding protein [Chlorella vulgaris]
MSAMSAMSAAEHQAVHHEQQQHRQQQQQRHSKRCLPAECAAADGGGGPQPRAAVGDTAATARTGPGGLTDYELQRLQRIQRNREVMHGLGLSSVTLEVQKPAAAAPCKRRRPCKQAAVAAGDAAAGAAPPSLRWTRSRGPKVAKAGEAGGPALQGTTPGAVAEAEAQAGLVFDDSSVRRYVCQALTAAAPPNITCGGRSGAGLPDQDGGVAGLVQLPGCLRDPALARAYSVDWRPGLVVAGGKDGVVSVFGSRELEAGRLAEGDTLPPLLSHKLHKGWVSDVQLTSLHPSSSYSSTAAASSGPPLLLLTAGNDGAARLWDLGRAAAGGGTSGAPQQLAQTNNLHTGGIFSLHEKAGRVLSASKDGSVTISSLGGSSGTASLAAVQRYETLHEGVVKCARWQRAAGGSASATTFASCGNDRRLCIVDSRLAPAAGASLVIEGSHATALNCLRWHPTSDHLLLTCSHDPAILLHDLRSPAQPLHRLRGHAPGPRIASMYQPAFVAGGAAVATGCERSQLLTLYCTSTGALMSCGEAGITAGATCCGSQPGDPFICTAGRAVYFFLPRWHTRRLHAGQQQQQQLDPPV